MKQIEQAIQQADEVQVVGLPRGSNEDVLVNIIKVLLRRAGGKMDIPAAEYGAAAEAPIALHVSNHNKGTLTVAIDALTDVDKAVIDRLERPDAPSAKPVAWV